MIFWGEHFLKKFSKNFQKYSKKFQKIFKKFQKIFKKYSENFQKILKKISKNFKRFSKIFKNFLKKIAKNALFLHGFLTSYQGMGSIFAGLDETGHFLKIFEKIIENFQNFS